MEQNSSRVPRGTKGTNMDNVLIKKTTYDVIVIGAGHAGCEAALSAARTGCSTLLLTINLDTIAQMSCNPSIGGPGKGQIVREIDALGGEMGRNIDETAIQLRILNTKKGEAVQAYRAQADKKLYQQRMKNVLENTPNLEIVQDIVNELVVENGKVKGVITATSVFYKCKKLIITTGTFLNGYIHRGLFGYSGGRDGELASTSLSASLSKIGLKLGRLKTGTPARLNKRTIDYKILEPQYSEEKPVLFSFLKPTQQLPKVPCYITYTNLKTHAIIKNNLHRSPLYSGKIVGIGPKYCPSIEDKVIRFAQRERHQIFLEPEGLDNNEVYVNGLSTSLPGDIQSQLIHSIVGLEEAEILRFGYGIEYDFVYPEQIFSTLETKKIKGLYLAGQINGTSGYEEAAAQGLMAGINASLNVQKKKPLILRRDQAYIGVLIDDLITKMPTEPYRIFTSQAEYRLLLRNDNADSRLTEIGYKTGLATKERHNAFLEKKQLIETEKALIFSSPKLSRLFKSGDNVNFDEILKSQGRNKKELSDEVKESVSIEIKYKHYIEIQQKEINNSKKLESKKLSQNIDYTQIKGLKKEAQQKLNKVQPKNIGQASRIAGVSPADISLLLVFLKKKPKK